MTSISFDNRGKFKQHSFELETLWTDIARRDLLLNLLKLSSGPIKFVQVFFTFSLKIFVSVWDSCGFDTGDKCNWTNMASNSANYTWMIHKGATPSKGTGPAGDHSISGQGKR